MRRLVHACATLACVASLAACAPTELRNPLATWVPSPNHGPRRPSLIVIHHTEQDSVRESLDTLRTRNAGGPVSAHYLIGDDGHIWQLVADDRRAWHAGGGSWGDITDVNSASIGIELDNDGREPFSDAQVDSLLRLLADLTTRWRIRPERVIGHGDMAPGRKVDPSALFPWHRLAQAGFGLWPDTLDVAVPADFDPWRALHRIGYGLDDREATVRAFHRHFRGSEGAALDETDLRILHALTRVR
ncbi:N-acetylmuramoyl-L-alanine amidase [Coralloluteibacterium stylophorae]|uniref:N-acetylmuramoyl-L-alanine amidase n=1 Tax=Coralloluteibacterium stylophorae TaxID=1776034 RepID=A0A8J7VVN0_9GAMM|nr:N-acetylmuramoyl-L-alanine amidase [Coralloluteibacterium stylophorae]MBS7457543.1 N-acetylmuramoyl-L-alanine amidase [Coralloluteibacterium stylophorae]